MGVSWLINGGDPNHLLTGMILQVVIQAVTFLGMVSSRDPLERDEKWPTQRLGMKFGHFVVW